MNKKEKILSGLMKKRRELLERLDRVNVSQRKSHDRDQDEQAVERENDEIVDALGENILKELEQINRAGSRLEAGTYNICSSCKGAIGYERLEAIPYTELCIKCASGEV